MSEKYYLSTITELLNPDNTISANRPLAHAIGMTETMIFSALISKQSYYAKNGMLQKDGWFYSTIEDLQKSTTFGAKAQRSAVARLVEFGLIECAKKGMPAKRYFRIADDLERLSELIALGERICESISGDENVSVTFRTPESGHQEVRNPNFKFVPPAVTSDSPQAAARSGREDITSDDPAHIKSKEINPKKNNPELKSFFRSDAREGANEGMKEQKDKPLSFSETLYEIGGIAVMKDEPVCEEQFSSLNEDERGTQHCRIPYTFKKDKQAMAYALKYLSAFSYHFTGDQAKFFDNLINFIPEMTEPDSIQVCGQRVMYYEIIDKLNEAIHKGCLSEWLLAFKAKWSVIISERKIVNPRMYLMSCLWGDLNEYVRNIDKRDKERAVSSGSIYSVDI